MNIKKSKIVLALGALLFLSVPLSSAFADQKHNENKEMPMGDTMQFIKNELRGYVQGVKGDDEQKMQQHLDKLLTLSAVPADQTPVKVKKLPAAMGHEQMNHEQMGMSEMEHANMDQGDMAMGHSDMANDDMKMDHSKMADEDLKMDHSNMANGDMKMDHSKMDHSAMKMDGADHDMSSMEGMSPAQHQHMIYMQGMTGLNDLFKQLDKTQDKAEIKSILGKIKEQLKKNQ